MILNSFFKLIISFVISAFNIILLPLDFFLRSSLNYVYNDLLVPINDLFNSIINFIPFIADLTFLPSFVIHLIVNYLVFKYTVLFGSYTIKLIVKWWNSLKG